MFVVNEVIYEWLMKEMKNAMKDVCPACGSAVLYDNGIWKCSKCKRYWGIWTSKPVFELGV